MLTAVELFSGIGGFRIACDNLGISTVWANDHDALASGVYRKRFGKKNFHEGDIENLTHLIPEEFDLLTAGFPCQPFSSAGKKKGIDDPRGSLYQIIHDILKSKKPTFFMLENVKRLLTMKKGNTFRTILYTLAELDYDIEWRLVNAQSFSLPQNRERVVIIGTKGKQSASPILIDNPDLSTSKNLLEKKGSFSNWGFLQGNQITEMDASSFVVKNPNSKLRDILQNPQEVEERFYFTDSTISRLGENTSRNKFHQGVEILSNQEGGRRMGYTVFGINGVAPTLTRTTSRIYERYKVGSEYRILTNIEYARLQGFDDDHCELTQSLDGLVEDVPVMKQYKLYGNALPPNIAEWAIKRLINSE